eukprot:jgi/Mesen1/9653/ME000671S09008
MAALQALQARWCGLGISSAVQIPTSNSPPGPASCTLRKSTLMNVDADKAGLHIVQFDGLKSTSRSTQLPTRRLSINTPKCSQASLAVRAEQKSDDGRVQLRLKVDLQVQFGERVAVLGSPKWLGRWEHPVEMTWSESGWILDVAGAGGEEAEFKFLILGTDGGEGTAWEDGHNRHLKLPDASGQAFELLAKWSSSHDQADLKPLGEAQLNVPQKTQESAPVKEQQPQQKQTQNGDEGSDFVNRWQGKEASFMRSNDHSHDRHGKWDTEGLQGAALHLVGGDQKAGNWWRKLEVVKELVQGKQESGAELLDALVHSAIYLQWINSGQIVCVEDGGHHRPNKHAEISRHIFRSLERLTSTKGVSPEEVMVIRKIHPRLPAFTAEFTASVPLTRIRDIAHRNDIPHDLKQEIKHTIQNKLHRNAGPEDLVATEALLRRVSSPPGQYSEAFVEQLRIFYRELKDFFNAASLTEQLEAVRDSLDDSGTHALDSFLAAKQRLDGGGNLEGLVGALHALTGLRAALLAGLRSGLRNDASDASIAMRQKWRLAEIGLEDYSFVLLSQVGNAVEAAGGAPALAAKASAGRGGSHWNHALGATVLGVRQLGLSGWQQPECIAIENELAAWQEAGLDQAAPEEEKKEWALRLKATLDRARRLAEAYSEALLRLYPAAAQTLGRSLDIPDNTVRTYTEAEIRASVVFQLAKQCSLLLKAVRALAGSEGWDPLMTGSAVGVLTVVDRIVPGALPAHAENNAVVLLVKEADGDEEVKAAGPNVAGVILCHELPHLSHLGVRARQEGVVFVTCDDEDRIADVRALEGKAVRLDASSESVTVVAHEGALPDAKVLAAEGVSAAVDAVAASGQSAPSTGSQPKKVVHGKAGAVLELADADVAQTGAKAAACGELARLSQSSTAQKGTFQVPAGVCIPFGAMEEVLRSSGSFDRFADLVAKTESAAVAGGELDGVCNELRELVLAQQVPKAVVDKVAAAFPADARLIVRSSANVEDLAGMSGAGLYDSIPNVRPSEAEDFGKAVAGVWASLYTRRAVLSRRVGGVKQADAAMAVLVQQMLAPDVSFVLHTRSPVDGDENVVQAELALGLGETLASGTRGSPWRLATNKTDGSTRTLAFANFSELLSVSSSTAADGTMVSKVADYSKQALSRSSDARKDLGRRLAAVGQYLEKELGCAQDIEGCLVGDDIYIVQARPQP